MDLPGGLRVADPADVDARSGVAVSALERLTQVGDRWELELTPLALTIVDAILHADAATLTAIAEPLRRARADVDVDGDVDHAEAIGGYLAALLDSTELALERLPDPAEFALAQDTHARRFLDALDGAHELTSADLKARLATSDSQVSRVGRTLLAAGLVIQRRAGRVALWELTPRGRQVLRDSAGRRDRAAR